MRQPEAGTIADTDFGTARQPRQSRARKSPTAPAPRIPRKPARRGCDRSSAQPVSSSWSPSSPLLIPDVVAMQLLSLRTWAPRRFDAIRTPSRPLHYVSPSEPSLHSRRSARCPYPATVRVYLCRHAQAAAGEPDELRELTSEGVEQARALGARLAARGHLHGSSPSRPAPPVRSVARRSRGDRATVRVDEASRRALRQRC
jgi:hypothetical protein